MIRSLDVPLGSSTTRCTNMLPKLSTIPMTTSSVLWEKARSTTGPSMPFISSLIIINNVRHSYKSIFKKPFDTNLSSVFLLMILTTPQPLLAVLML